MGRLFTILLVAAGLYGAYLAIRDYKERRFREANRWDQVMSPLIKGYNAVVKWDSPEAHNLEADFYRILYMAHRTSQDGYSVGETIKKAVSPGDEDSVLATLVSASINENLDILSRLGVLNDPANLLSMERGEVPILHGQGWDGEKLVIGRLVSPAIAPEAAFVLPNLRLMPESVRDTQDDLVSPRLAADISRHWLQCQLIVPETAKLISAMAKEMSRDN